MSDYGTVTAIAMVSTSLPVEISEKVDNYKRALGRLEKLCHAVIGSRSGTISKLPGNFGLGDAFELRVPAEEVTGLRELVDRAQDETGLEIVIGVGHDIHEAKVAAENADSDDSDILVYHPDMDDVSKYIEVDDDLKKSDPIVEAKKILKDIKQNADLYEQIRAKNPKAYRAIIDTLQSLVQAVAAQKEDEANDVQEAGDAQKTVDAHGKKHEKNHIQEAKGAMKEAVSQVPIREQSEPQVAEESGPEQLQAPQMSPEVLQAVMQQTQQKYEEQKSGTLMNDQSIESDDYSYSEDPEFSKSLRYVLEHGSIYG